MFMLRSIVACAFLGQAVAGPVVITGATGETGVFLYKLLKAQGVEVRGFVRNVTKAKEKLGCSACDESEGIFVGDIAEKQSMTKVMQGAGALIILTASREHCDSWFPRPTNCAYSKGAFPKDIDWQGNKNVMEVFVQTAGLKPAMLVSSIGTTLPDSFLDIVPNTWMIEYKLNFEAALMSSGLPFTIFKPCALGYGKGHNATIVVGHDDEFLHNVTAGASNVGTTGPNIVGHAIDRADVARVIAAAVAQPSAVKNLRFDLCVKPGKATTDTEIPAIFKAARYPWQEASETVV